MKTAKAQEVLAKCFDGFRNKISIVDAKSENNRVAVSLSLIIANLRSLDIEWKQASESNEEFFSKLESILSGLQKTSKQTVILDAQIAQNTQKSLNYINSVKQLDSSIVSAVLQQLMN